MAAAQGGAKHGVVDADDGAQAGLVVVAEDDLFVLVLGQLPEKSTGRQDLGVNHGS